MQLTKHHGLGNDFLVLFADATPERVADLARELCHRRTGIGADGLIIRLPPTPADRSAGADHRMLLLNSDGSEAEISGNGIRCLGQAIARRDALDTLDTAIATGGGLRRLSIDGPPSGPTVLVRVEMGAVVGGPRPSREDVLAAAAADDPAAKSVLCGVERWATADVGNPHIVLQHPSVQSLNDDHIVSAGRSVERFFDGGINVLFACARGRRHLDLKVWERGAGLTQACGSGAVAASWVTRRWGIVDDHVAVDMPGGSAQVDFDDDLATLTGPATHVANLEVLDG